MGVIANNPHHLSGAIDSESADKGARFMQLCDAFDIPILSLMDCPGVMVGPDVERTGQLKRRHIHRDPFAHRFSVPRPAAGQQLRGDPLRFFLDAGQRIVDERRLAVQDLIDAPALHRPIRSIEHRKLMGYYDKIRRSGKITGMLVKMG